MIAAQTRVVLDPAFFDRYLAECDELGVEPLSPAQLERLLQLLAAVDDELDEARPSLH